VANSLVACRRGAIVSVPRHLVTRSAMNRDPSSGVVNRYWSWEDLFRILAASDSRRYVSRVAPSLIVNDGVQAIAADFIATHDVDEVSENEPALETALKRLEGEVGSLAPYWALATRVATFATFATNSHTLMVELYWERMDQLDLDRLEADAPTLAVSVRQAQRQRTSDRRLLPGVYPTPRWTLLAADEIDRRTFVELVPKIWAAPESERAELESAIRATRGWRLSERFFEVLIRPRSHDDGWPSRRDHPDWQRSPRDFYEYFEPRPKEQSDT
jgi:hypothetical protein